MLRKVSVKTEEENKDIEKYMKRAKKEEIFKIKTYLLV